MIKRVKIDNELIKSLIKSSSNKVISARSLKLNETTATSIISLTYDGLRELLEAIALSNGYKIYNHICYTAFLKTLLKEEDMAETFESFRKLRNGINYYGEEVAVDDVKIILKDMESFIKRCKGILENV